MINKNYASDFPKRMQFWNFNSFIVKEFIKDNDVFLLS